METTIDHAIKGMARPNRKNKINTEPCWVTIVDIDGDYMEWVLYDGDTMIARDNSSMELLEPVYARELYIEITSEDVLQYTLTVTKAKEI